MTLQSCSVFYIIGLSFFLQSCVTTEIAERQSELEALKRTPFVASNFILSKVTKFDQNKNLLAIETAQFDVEENEINYFYEDRKKGTFQRKRVKYLDDGLVQNRISVDRDGQVIWDERFQHDVENRIKGSTTSFKDDSTSASHIQLYQYELDQLLSRTVITSPGTKIIESDEYSYLPTGHLSHRISTRSQDGEEISTWARFEYDVTNRIAKRIHGEGVDIAAGTIGYELYGYDSNDNLIVVNEKDASGNTVSLTRYEYFYAGEPAYNRTQHLLQFNL